MQLAILTAVLAAIASAESGGGPVSGLAWRLLIVASAALIAPVAALVGTQRLAASISASDDPDDAVWRLQTGIICLWLVAVALILLVAQWPQIVRSNWQLAAWPLVDELAILLPVVASLLLVWATFYRLERVALLARSCAHQVQPPARMMRYLWLQTRHHLGLVLLPPLAIVGLFETLAALKIPAVHIDTAWWLIAPLLATTFVLMPAALRRVWRTTSLPPGPLRVTLDLLCRERKCRVQDILLWHTDGTMANAAVIGISRWLRYILLTDALVDRLNDDQIAAVVRHELAHLRRWHLPLRLAVLLLPIAWWLSIKQAWPGGEEAVHSALSMIGIRPALAAAFGVPVAMLAYTVIIVGWCSRLLEHDADLDACLSADGRLDPVARHHFCSALITLCGHSYQGRFSQWLHPPVMARVGLLRRVAIDPMRVASFRRRVAWLSAGVAVMYVGAMILAAW
jgi:STE24 endopeptidase